MQLPLLLPLLAAYIFHSGCFAFHRELSKIKDKSAAARPFVDTVNQNICVLLVEGIPDRLLLHRGVVDRRRKQSSLADLGSNMSDRFDIAVWKIEVRLRSIVNVRWSNAARCCGKRNDSANPENTQSFHFCDPPFAPNPALFRAGVMVAYSIRVRQGKFRV